MINTIINIKKISLVFFVTLGLAHLLTTILISNNIWLKGSTITSKIVAIPFAITGIIYGLSSLRISLSKPDTDHAILNKVLIGISIIAFIGLLIVNLAFPNINS